MLRRSFMLAILLAFPTVAYADRMFPLPGIERIALADAIIVGRVSAIEPVDIDLAKTKHRVAVVMVTETILGKKETKSLRVAFLPVDEKVSRNYPPIHFRLAMNQNGLMFLRKHATDNVYVGTMEFDFIQNPGNAPANTLYTQTLEQARNTVKLMADPIAGLKSKEIADRSTVAAHLIVRYRTPKVANAKTEPLSAEESKLIFEALLEQDWTQGRLTANPWQSFNMLGVTEKDGWRAPKQLNNINDLRTAVQTWYREHGKTYRIQRYVAESAK